MSFNILILQFLDLMTLDPLVHEVTLKLNNELLGDPNIITLLVFPYLLHTSFSK